MIIILLYIPHCSTTYIVHLQKILAYIIKYTHQPNKFIYSIFYRDLLLFIYIYKSSLPKLPVIRKHLRMRFQDDLQ